MTADPDRHLSLASFARYARATIPIEHPIPGTPRLVLFVDPDGGRMGLRGPAGDRKLPPVTPQHLELRTIHYRQQRLTEISVTDPALFPDGYLLLCGVADRVQIDHLPMMEALTETVRRMGHLLSAHVALPADTETGLLGELCLLSGATTVVGPGPALDSWRGTAGEEHDFGLADADVEVKTTTGDRRAHWISSVSQLLPTGTRPLWLVSVQVTDAGAGGRTLADLVAGVRQRFQEPADRDRYDALLWAAGWRERHAETNRRRWRLRTGPATYAVGDDFPRLTPDQLAVAGVDQTRITDIRYRIDLSGRTPGSPPALIADAVTAAQQELT